VCAKATQFLPLPIPPGSPVPDRTGFGVQRRGEPVIDFVFQKQEHDVLDDANDGIIRVSSPDPGRALITGRADDTATFTFGHANAFKISPLRGIRKTAPYFQDNPAKTQLDEQDKKDIIAFLKLLD
jgi:hypothetical protein